MAEAIYIFGILCILIGFAKMLNDIEKIKGEVFLILLMAVGIALLMTGAHLLK